MTKEYVKGKVSILILAYNNLTYTKQCIDSILRNTSQSKTPHEIIVVNNGSTDGTKEYLVKLDQEKAISALNLSYNSGFPAGCNAAAEMATGEYVLLLNNDTIVTPGWLEKLIRGIKSDPLLAAVGCFANYSGGYQASPVPCTYKGPEELDKFAEKYSQGDREVDFLVFFCCLIRRKVWNEVGGLDEEFTPGNYEDNLFCWRACNELGYKMKIVGDCYIHHYVGKSFKYNEDPIKLKEYNLLLAKNQKTFMRKVGRYQEISLCMIVGDKEDPKTLARCLDSVAPVVDELCVVFNYKTMPNPLRIKKLKEVLENYRKYDLDIETKYLKWTNFSDMRNKSLDMATGDYCMWIDCDDVMDGSIAIRDVMVRNLDIEVFRFNLKSATELGTQERIIKSFLFKNKKEYRFVNRVHEDVVESLNKSNAKWATIGQVTINHLGYLDYAKWKQKNLRNYKLLQLDLKDNPKSLTYYHIVNCLLIIGGKENCLQAVKYIDECFEKLQLKKEDPLTPKLWMIRGVACMDADQHLAAKQSLHKSWDEWKHPEAGVNLAEIYIREKDYDKALLILNEMYGWKEFQLTNTPIDVIQAEFLMLQKLGDCYVNKFQKENKPEYMITAEKHYREALTVRQNLKVVNDLCVILRNTGREDEAAGITRRAVNMFPGYYVGFQNLGAYEIKNKCYHTAKLFLQEALRLKPDLTEARHNLKMVNAVLNKGVKK